MVDDKCDENPRMFRTNWAALTELRGFAGSEGSKSLILLDRTSKGLHYRSAGDRGSSAVIFGGGCAGNSSLRWLSSSRWSGSGSV